MPGSSPSCAAASLPGAPSLCPAWIPNYYCTNLHRLLYPPHVVHSRGFTAPTRGTARFPTSCEPGTKHLCVHWEFVSTSASHSRTPTHLACNLQYLSTPTSIVSTPTTARSSGVQLGGGANPYTRNSNPKSHPGNIFPRENTPHFVKIPGRRCGATSTRAASCAP